MGTAPQQVELKRWGSAPMTLPNEQLSEDSALRLSLKDHEQVKSAFKERFQMYPTDMEIWVLLVSTLSYSDPTLKGKASVSYVIENRRYQTVLSLSVAWTRPVTIQSEFWCNSASVVQPSILWAAQR